MSWGELSAERARIIDGLHAEIARKNRQLAEARSMIRMALKFGCQGEPWLTNPEGCARDTRKSLELRLPKLDDRRKKRSTR